MLGCQFPTALTPRTPFYQGKPKPQASWTHNGHALDSQRVNVRSGDQDSILFIRSVQRSDSGCYELTVRLEGLEAKAAIDILVIGMGPRRKYCLPRDPEHPPAPPGLMWGWREQAKAAWQEPSLGCGDRMTGPASCPLPFPLWPYRETWAPQQHQTTGRLGLQCCP